MKITNHSKCLAQICTGSSKGFFYFYNVVGNGEDDRRLIVFKRAYSPNLAPSDFERKKLCNCDDGLKAAVHHWLHATFIIN